MYLYYLHFRNTLHFEPREDILSKYKKIMLKLHPDSNQDTDTTKLAQIVGEAKETILKNDFS